MPHPPIAMSCGEPAGIGPELAVKAWLALGADLPFVWIGDPSHLPRGCPAIEIADMAEAAEAAQHGVPVWALRFDGDAPEPGTPRPEHAAGVIAAISEGVRLVHSGACAALTTLPIHKAALKAGAGFAFPGHTEFLADLAGVERVVMMLASPLLKVVPATIHIPLAEVPRALTADGLAHTLRITHAALQTDFGIASPRLAVAGLNPHAGEDGTMGREEIEVIAPVLDALRNDGLDIAGPLSADTLFHAEARARYDAAVAMYHDQALIPIKTLDFSGGVNVTLGLPFIRTSPDHGTAFDIAGTGVADPTSTIAALRLAADMAETRAAHGGIDALPPLREVIAAHGLSARKALGQNFLLDLNLTAKIARVAGDLTQCDVLEIGPGPGGLTRGLLASGARHVVAVEKDRRCLPALAEIAAAYPGRLTVIEGDALALADMPLTPPYKIAANLPYNVGTELLVRWLTPSIWPPDWTSLTLMFQREVAERIVAAPGSKAYGRLAVLAQWRAETQIAMTLPPSAFTPPPKVSSAVVHLTALAAPRFPADPEVLGRVVAKAFNQRRKMLRAALRGLHPEVETVLWSVGIDPTRRAETVTLEEFCALARALA